MDMNDKIIEKIRNLLELAEDGGNDEESQTALLMAQKLMLKHKISQNDVSQSGKNEIVLRSLSIYKRLFWWEKRLAKVIAENFRVMLYIQSNQLPHISSIVRKIVYMGFQEDVDLAYELFHLAAENMKYHAKQHLQVLKEEKEIITNDIRKAYYTGFIDGLSKKFEEQRHKMQTENAAYALMIQVPNEIKEAFDEAIGGKKMMFKTPTYTQENVSYLKGYEKGNRVSLTRHYLDHDEK